MIVLTFISHAIAGGVRDSSFGMLDRSFGLLAGLASAVYLSAAVTIQSTDNGNDRPVIVLQGRQNVAPGETRRHGTGIGCTRRLGPYGLDRA